MDKKKMSERTLLKAYNVDVITRNEKCLFVQKDETRSYEPFDYYESEKDNLYMKIANLNENCTKDITDFIKEFGFLGVYVKTGKVPSSLCEGLTDWKLEIYRIRFILKIYAATSSSDAFTNFFIEGSYKEDLSQLQELLKQIISLCLHYDKKPEYDLLECIETEHLKCLNRDYFDESKNKKPTLKEKLPDLKMAMLTYLKTIVNEKVEGVRHRIWSIINNKNSLLEWNQPDYDEGIMCDTLSQAIYSMLYQDLLRGKRLFICKYCGDYFMLKKNDRKKSWCSQECSAKLRRKHYTEKMHSDPLLEKFLKTYKRMDGRYRTSGSKGITLNKWEDFKLEARGMKGKYINNQISSDAFLKWLEIYK